MARNQQPVPGDPDGTETVMYPDEFQATLEWLDKYKAQKRGDPEQTLPDPPPRKK